MSFSTSHAGLWAHFLGTRSPHVIFPRISARKDYAHEAHTLGYYLAMDPFFPDVLNLVPGAHGE